MGRAISADSGWDVAGARGLRGFFEEGREWLFLPVTERGDRPSAHRGQADSQPETSAFIQDSGLSVHKKTRPLETPSVHALTLAARMHTQERTWTVDTHGRTKSPGSTFPGVHTVCCTFKVKWEKQD